MFTRSPWQVRDHSAAHHVAGFPCGTCSGNGLRTLAAGLRATGFAEDAIAAMVGVSDGERLLSDIARYAYVIEDSLLDDCRSAVGVLSWLFVFNKTLPVERAKTVLEADLLRLLHQLGLLHRDGRRLRASVSITPYGSRFFLSDQLFISDGPQQLTLNRSPDLVMPPHASSLLVLHGMRPPTGSLLDVGCGGGFLALMAGASCGRVVGVDINPRCVSVAHANAALNDLPAQFLVGDFASLSFPEDERFDSLVFNTPTRPFGPDGGTELGQLTAEHLLTRVVGVLPGVLRAGGTADVQVLVEVPHGVGSVRDTICRWFPQELVAGWAVQEIDSPHFSVTSRQLSSGRLHGYTLLATDSTGAEGLVALLRARGVSRVSPAMVSIRHHSTVAGVHRAGLVGEAR